MRAKLRGGVWEGVEPPGGAVRVGELSHPPLSVLGSLGVTQKAPARCPAPGSKCRIPDTEGGGAGGGRRPKQKEEQAGSWAAGGAAATLPEPPRNPGREEPALCERPAERGGQHEDPRDAAGAAAAASGVAKPSWLPREVSEFRFVFFLCTLPGPGCRGESRGCLYLGESGKGQR